MFKKHACDDHADYYIINTTQCLINMTQCLINITEDFIMRLNLGLLLKTNVYHY